MLGLLTIALISVAIAALLVMAFYRLFKLDFPSRWGFAVRTLAGACIITLLALTVSTLEMHEGPDKSATAPQDVPAPASPDTAKVPGDKEPPSGGAAKDDIEPMSRPRMGAPRSANQPKMAAPRPGTSPPAASPSPAPPSEAPSLPGSEPDTAASPPDVPETAPPELSEPKPPEVAGAPAPAEADPADWNIVPVFYGTDRERHEIEKKISYDWQRGRRLELGRALVTIPKDHVVPMVERPWAIRIPYIDVTLYEAAEDPKRHFTISELKALSREEFLALVKARLEASTRFEDHALVFVHGYKTTFENALYRTAQITYDLKFDGAPFLYSWPSGGTLQGYTYDRESAAQAEPYFREFLETVVNDTEAKKVSVIAHSMGNQLLLRVLQDLKRSLPEGVQISQLILAAPDVDRHSFENIVRSIDGIAEGITLYSAANDQALLASRRVNGGIPRAGDVPDDGPIILQGVDTIDATASSMDSVGVNHSGYAENNALLQDIGRLILSGVRPPEKRLPTLERVTTDRGIYWRYPAIAPGVVGHAK